MFFLDETFDELTCVGAHLLLTLSCSLQLSQHCMHHPTSPFLPALALALPLCAVPFIAVSQRSLPPLPLCSYDSSTTVAEAVEMLAQQMKLENYQTFTLFAVHKGKGPSEPGMPATDEHVLLDDNRYVADVVYDFKVRLGALFMGGAGRQGSGGAGCAALH